MKRTKISSKKSTRAPAKQATRVSSTRTSAGAKPDASGTSGEKADRWDAISIAEQDVVVLQVIARFSSSVLEDIVFQEFQRGAHRRRPQTAWLAFAVNDKLHHLGKSSWIGFSKSTPLVILAAVQASLEARGLDVDREMGRALYLEMSPFARLSDDGLEIMVPAALVGDPTRRRAIDRGGVAPVARGYQLQASRTAALQQLFFGADDSDG